MSVSWKKKILTVKLAIAQGVFNAGGNEITLTDNGIACTIEKPGLPDKNSARVQIYGMSLSDMETATVLPFKSGQLLKNRLIITAGDADKTSTVFTGEVTSAYGNFDNAPDPYFEIEATEGGYASSIPSDTVSIQRGAETVEEVMRQLANEAGFSFVNSGVSGASPSVVLSGDPMKKIRDYASAVGVKAVIDNDVLIVFPRGGKRTGTVPLLNKDTGLIGYPKITNTGITASCFFNPDIAWGSYVKVESVTPRTSGLWQVSRVTHYLENNTVNGGQWCTEFDAAIAEDSTVTTSGSRGRGY